ncbi:hypothetical protein Y032_0013g1927 [Ancylostoma ceylanicum]|uniref:Uncharacterized protein n=1 Tax=Ancylostoma ceylanicum TaxID=53326 RepID=A0A016VB51_9BILA|nr:hypothetical protein Y032_0013g1927 [Ancylostoma ceylanicum]
MSSTATRINKRKDSIGSPLHSVAKKYIVDQLNEEFYSSQVSLSLSAHMDTLSSFFDNATNVPRDVTDAFRAVQSLIKSAYKSPEQYVHERSLVIQGIPELPPSASSASRQMDVENKVMEILDALSVESRPCSVSRMGRPSEVRPPLTKVVLPSGSHYFMVLGKARRLRELP